MSIVRRVILCMCAAGILSAGAAVLYFVTTHSPRVIERDATTYWAPARLLIHGENPFDAQRVQKLQREAGIRSNKPYFMYNPPWALTFLLPLGFLSDRNAIFLWELLSAACLLISTRLLWELNGKQPNRLHLVAYMFAPVVACFAMGQIVPLMLLGFLLFLRWHRRYPLAAGLALSLLALKPHLAIPFGVVLLAQAGRQQERRFLYGAIAGVAGASCIPLCLDWHIFSDYVPAFRAASAVSYTMPDPSSLLQMADPKGHALLYLPALCGSLWALWWYRRNAAAWRWDREGVFLLAVSVFVAPHRWLMDEALMLPAVLAGVYRSESSRAAFTVFGVLNCAALALEFSDVQVTSWAYAWTSAAWLAWCVWVSIRQRSLASEDASELAGAQGILF